MNGRRTAMLALILTAVLSVTGCGHAYIHIQAPATSKIALQANNGNGKYVIALEENSDGISYLGQTDNLDDPCSWFSLRRLDSNKVALLSCHNKYVTAPQIGGDAKIDWALYQRRGLSKCGEFSWLELNEGQVALISCAARFVTPGTDIAGWEGAEWLVIGQVTDLKDWEKLTVLRE